MKQIKYSFNIGDKIKIDKCGLFTYVLKDAIGVITSKTANDGEVLLDYGFNVEILEHDKEVGRVWRLSCLSTFELLEVSDSENKIAFKDDKSYKTMIKHGLVEFVKDESYIEDMIENHMRVIDDYFNPIFSGTRRELYICTSKDCIYDYGAIVEIVEAFSGYVVITDGNDKNVFRDYEFEECFSKCVKMTDFKVLEDK